jgi:hypothetical protein
MRRPTPIITAMARNVRSMYRARLSPRATALFSVPQLHSEPAIAAAKVTATSPPSPNMNDRMKL